MCYSIIQNDVKNGNYTNPYDFRRYWIVKRVGGVNPAPVSREAALEAKLNQIEQTLRLVLERTEAATASTSKGKSKPNSEDPGLLTRLRSSFSQAGQQEANDDNQSTSSSAMDQPPPYEEHELSSHALTFDPTTEKLIYIKQIQLTLNGAPLGMVNLLFIVVLGTYPLKT